MKIINQSSFTFNVVRRDRRTYRHQPQRRGPRHKPFAEAAITVAAQGDGFLTATTIRAFGRIRRCSFLALARSECPNAERAWYLAYQHAAEYAAQHLNISRLLVCEEVGVEGGRKAA